MSAVTLDQTLEMAMQLPADQQEMLVEILKRRQSERTRREIAADARTSIAEFRSGYLAPQSAEEVIAELGRSLEH